MTFDKKLLLSTFAPKVVAITLEHDGKTVDLFVKELSARQVFDLQAKQKQLKAKEEASIAVAAASGALPEVGVDSNEVFTAALVAQALCDENGQPVLTVEDAKELATMQVGAFGKLSAAVAKAVGLEVPAKSAPATTSEPAVPNTGKA